MIRNELLSRYEKRNEDMTKEVSGIHIASRGIFEERIRGLLKKLILSSYVCAVGILQGAERCIDQETGRV